MMRKNLLSVSMLALAVAVVPACASKGFVREEVGNVNAKVDTLSTTLEETQERTRENAERIGEVDQRAQAAARSAAEQATQAQASADAAAASAREGDTQINGRIDSVVAESRRLIFEVTLSEDQGNFEFGKAELPDPAKARLDQLVADLKQDPKGVYIEIEGHTDNVGPAELNERLGLDRAESVKRYLYEQHQVPLHKINVFSYGEDKPIAPNDNRDGRAQNRRVVVRVLS